MIKEKIVPRETVTIVPLAPQHKDRAFAVIERAIADSFKWEFRHPESKERKYMPKDIDYLDVINQEVAKQRKHLQESLSGEVEGRKYLAAFSEGGRICGIMGYDRSISGEIVKALPHFSHLVHKEDIDAQVIAAYVDPDFQQKGIASQLFNTILNEFGREGIRRFALFSGYEKGQIAWTRLLHAAPNVSLVNYYEDGADCWVWVMELKQGQKVT